MRPKPPLTEEELALAVLSVPPLTEGPKPLALLFNPPLILAKGAAIRLNRPARFR